MVFLDEKNIKGETNKTPTIVAHLRTSKSRFRYIKTWVYSSSCENIYWSFENLKTFEVFVKENAY